MSGERGDGLFKGVGDGLGSMERDQKSDNN